MVNVSDKFKTLSMQNGRQISCKIIAGGETFLDDRLIEFDFDDVIHPNWYTIGSTCSNRFAFSVRYSGELEVHDEVRPYISFDGEEWCPLGVFFVARRYVRGNYASIICYDRMYSLEMEYVPRVTAPTTVKAILNDINENYGVQYERGISDEYKVETVPVGATVRDVLGFVSGIVCANMKYNREGKLVLRKYSQMDKFYLSVNNCMDYSRNMSSTKISRLVVDTGNTSYEVGSGGELSTLELYNPLLTQPRAKQLLLLFSVMIFYSADIELQGLPFLESGDHIFLLDENNNSFPIAISEIEFHYDGGLTARLYSRTRSYTDAAIHQDDLNEALERIRASLGNICLKSVNSADISVSSEEVRAASFEFETRVSGTFAQTDLNFTLYGAGTAEIKAYVNGELVRESLHETDGSKELVHFYFVAENLPKGSNTVYVVIRAESGEMSIKSGGLVATLVCRGAAGGNEKVRDRLTVSEKLQKAGLTSAVFGIRSFDGNIDAVLTENQQ